MVEAVVKFVKSVVTGELEDLQETSDRKTALLKMLLRCQEGCISWQNLLSRFV